MISAQIPPRDGSGGALTSGRHAVQRAAVSQVTLFAGKPRVAPPIGRRVGSGSGVAHRVRHRHPCQLLRPVHTEEVHLVGSVIKKRRKRMAKKKHRKLLKKTRVQRRNKK